MPELISASKLTELEQQLLHIRSVTAARIVCSSTGAIDEIHVIGTPSRSPKQVVRDVETMLLVQHQLRVDHRKISLVQMTEQRFAAPPRILLLDVQANDAGEDASAIVTLGFQDTRIQGVSRPRPGQTTTRENLVGYATTHALDQLITPYGHVRLEQVAQQIFGPIHICLAHLSLLVDDGLETLLGVSIIADDTSIAGARAVLDAVNRRLPRLMQL